MDRDNVLKVCRRRRRVFNAAQAVASMTGSKYKLILRISIIFNNFTSASGSANFGFEVIYQILISPESI